jgi:putative inorganic carbon (HCO3(-)) transporter
MLAALRGIWGDQRKAMMAAGLLFAVINAVLVAMEVFYAPLLPILLALVLLALFALDKLVLLIVFLTPLSVNITDIGGGVGMTLPTDPLLFGAMLLFLLKLMTERVVSNEVSNHPVTLAIIVNLAWILITSITSEMPMVSFKFFLSRLWYVVVFYFLLVHMMAQVRNMRMFIGLYLVAFTGIICYTVIHHGMYGFEEQPAHWVMSPFFNDHTSYGAALAFYYPLLLLMAITGPYGRWWKFGLWIMIGIFTIGLVLSYTRAAWISLIGAFGVYMAMRLRIPFKSLALAGIGLLIAFFSMKDQILMKLEKNRQDSSAEFAEHVQSISNISTDASNLERLNRWASAWEMFKERPFEGWGPGTYMFQYAPFQNSDDKTIISTNAGDKGNAHSEYIGPLAESGVFGMVSFIIVVICACYTSVMVWMRTRDPELRMLVMGSFLGLVTYFMHGMLNNFLDTDKASAPFWGFMALIVAVEVFHNRPADKASEQLDA